MKPSHALLPVLLCLLAACGGGGGGSQDKTPKTATTLAYADPTSGTYQLRRNATLSSGGHLVLELWGPAATTACGATLTLTLAGSGASWSNVQASDAAHTYVANGTAFDLGSGTPILKARLSGTTLQATAAQKGLTAPKALDKPLMRVALDLNPMVTPGTTLTLTPDPAKCQILNPDGSLSAIAVTASPITAN
ncbi:hypothetical protein [Mesoterricola sediminis]|uniref:Lipoprotein n=1 Tax=Mesoterricola sediminis TaxID=2927980 RepID=A0AA48HCG6_9BACT|nr:hypothetical protein [Mesoterricola sediminis]BDU75738.1 hypothetical protein METESE_06960 [Mesoterricola sediminis]